MLIVSPPLRKITQGKRVVEFIERYCVHPDGEWIGKPIVLEPWQRDLIYRLFELNEDGTRRYRWALVGLPKKNGKTTIAAALALYFLIADPEPSPLIPCAAASEDQADLIFGSAKTMCELSPPLREITERWDKEITVPSRLNARLVRVAAAAGTNDGKNIYVNMLDELHEWGGTKGRAVHNVLTNGTGARSQYLNFQITTAGHDIETVCGEQYEYGCQVAAGEVDDPRFFMYWRSGDPVTDWKSPDNWREANPQYGITLQPPFFEDQVKKGESTFKRYFLNLWTSSEEAWLEHGMWEACEAPDLELDHALPVSVGLDISNRWDATARVICQVQGDRLVVRCRTWANPYPPNSPLRFGWKVNHEEIMHDLREVYAAFPAPRAEVDGKVMPGPLFAYDPWNFQERAEELVGEGLAMVEFPQTDARMVPATTTLYEAIAKQRIAHNGDPILTRHIRAVTPDKKPRGERLSKPKGSTRHIDAAVALAMAVFEGVKPPPKAKRSVYESRGVATL